MILEVPSEEDSIESKGNSNECMDLRSDPRQEVCFLIRCPTTILLHHRTCVFETSWILRDPLKGILEDVVNSHEEDERSGERYC